jgi:hypothetical protein
MPWLGLIQPALGGPSCQLSSTPLLPFVLDVFDNLLETYEASPIPEVAQAAASCLPKLVEQTVAMELARPPYCNAAVRVIGVPAGYVIERLGVEADAVTRKGQSTERLRASVLVGDFTALPRTRTTARPT